MTIKATNAFLETTKFDFWSGGTARPRNFLASWHPMSPRVEASSKVETPNSMYAGVGWMGSWCAALLNRVWRSNSAYRARQPKPASAIAKAGSLSLPFRVSSSNRSCLVQIRRSAHSHLDERAPGLASAFYFRRITAKRTVDGGAMPPERMETPAVRLPATPTRRYAAPPAVASVKASATPDEGFRGASG